MLSLIQSSNSSSFVPATFNPNTGVLTQGNYLIARPQNWKPLWFYFDLFEAFSLKIWIKQKNIVVLIAKKNKYC